MSLWLVKSWYSSNKLMWLLLPLSWLYRWVIFCRRCCYQLGIFKQTKFPVSVIVVGNITVGGTGKTPLVIALANHLTQQGHHVGIVSRGYKAQANAKPTWVHPDSDPQQVGDEPLLIARRTQLPVMIGRDRVAAVKALLAKTPCNVVISDDGLQHYAFARDIEIAVIDGERRMGNGFCLPAGPLREPVTRLQTVDLIVANGHAGDGEYAMQLQASGLVNVKSASISKHINSVQGPVHAYAGIGNPQRFFASLRAMDLSIIEHPMPDHHHYQASDFVQGTVVMTEKDAIKCYSIAKNDWWYLPVNASLTGKFYHKIQELLHK